MPKRLVSERLHSSLLTPVFSSKKAASVYNVFNGLLTFLRYNECKSCLVNELWMVA
jgi:hypothetical protein